MSPASPAPDGWKRALLLAGATLLAVALSVLAITPKLVPWREHPLVYETTKVEPMTAQLVDPTGWEKIYLTQADFNGIQAIRWRLLPPVLGNVLGMSPHVYFTQPWLGLLVLVALSMHYALGRDATWLESLGLGVLIGTSSAFFSASCAVGYFDPLYIIPLLVVCYTPSPVLLLAACLAGPWVDEKFLFMLPACGLVRWSWKPETRWIWYAVAGIAPYCLMRVVALAMGDSSFSRQISMQGAMFWNYAPALPAGWWYGFRTGWVLILAGLWFTTRRLEPRLRWLLPAALVAAIGSISFFAWDTTRSIAMLLPLMLLGLQSGPWRKIVPGLALLNLFLPAAYVWCGMPVTVQLKSILSR